MQKTLKLLRTKIKKFGFGNFFEKYSDFFLMRVKPWFRNANQSLTRTIRLGNQTIMNLCAYIRKRAWDPIEKVLLQKSSPFSWIDSESIEIKKIQLSWNNFLQDKVDNRRDALLTSLSILITYDIYFCNLVLKPTISN